MFQTSRLLSCRQFGIQKQQHPECDAETSGESPLEANVEFLWLYLQTGPWEIDVASFLFLFFKTISPDDGDD